MASDKNVGNNMDTEVVVDMDTDLEADPDSVAEARDLGLAELEGGRETLLATNAMDIEVAGEEVVVDIVAVVDNAAAAAVVDIDNMENMVAAVGWISFKWVGWLAFGSAGSGSACDIADVGGHTTEDKIKSVINQHSIIRSRNIIIYSSEIGKTSNRVVSYLLLSSYSCLFLETVVNRKMWKNNN